MRTTGAKQASDLENQFRPVAHLEARENLAEMHPDRRQLQTQLRGDLLVLVRLKKKMRDFGLPGGHAQFTGKLIPSCLIQRR